jgi:pyruvate dehydrogenase E2 component (dihydrolipoamide acetyltransferase)
MPKMGLIMEEGLVREWLKQPGDQVTEGEVILVIETDKVSADVEAPASGVMGPILAEEGTSVPVGELIGYVLAPGEEPPPLPELRRGKPTAQTQSVKVSPDKRTTTPRSTVLASPVARRLAREHKIDLDQVDGSGPDGTVLEQDVLAYLEAKREIPQVIASPVARAMAAEHSLDLSRIKGSGPGGQIRKEDVERALAESTPVPVQASEVPPAPASPREELLELTSIQRVAAERLTTSFQTAPHFYLSTEVDASYLAEVRERLRESVEAKVGVPPTYTDLLVTAVAHALADRPALNATYAGGHIKRFGTINLGLAVDTPQGLVVPVIRGVDHKSISEVCAARSQLVQKAQAGKLDLDDLSGGTFTISNLGMFGVDVFQAIINPPQAAILAVGRIVQRVVAIDGEVQVRPMMWLTLSVDHRVADGAEAARFLDQLRQYLEDPYLLLT